MVHDDFEGDGMPEQRGFSHITVRSDDDEVVIYAGAAGGASGSADRARESAPPSESGALRGSGGAASQGADAADGRPSASPQPREAVQTLEDVERVPMPLAQKLVIASIAVIVVAFVLSQTVFA